MASMALSSAGLPVMKIMGTSRSPSRIARRQRQPVHVGHRDVADDGVEGPLLGQTGRLTAVMRHGDLETSGGERPRVAPGGDRLVVNDQHLRLSFNHGALTVRCAARRGVGSPFAVHPG